MVVIAVRLYIGNGRQDYTSHLAVILQIAYGFIGGLLGYLTFKIDTLSASHEVSLFSTATMHLALGQHKKAELLYRDLISRNTENYGYLEGLEKALNLKTPEERLALYAELIIEYPRSHCIKRMPLLIATGGSFKYNYYTAVVNVKFVKFISYFDNFRTHVSRSARPIPSYFSSQGDTIAIHWLETILQRSRKGQSTCST